MKRLHFTTLLLLLFSLMLFGCKKEGDEFVGNWKTERYELVSIEVARNNDAFIVTLNMPSAVNGKIETTKIPSQLVNGILAVKWGIETINMAVENTSGNLLFRDLEFKKISKETAEALHKKVQEHNKAIEEQGSKYQPSSGKTWRAFPNTAPKKGEN